VTNDDALFRHRLRVMATARELGNVRAACRIHGIHHSTFYRWKALADRHGLDMLRPRERRAPQMPNAIPVVIEQRILAYALAFPGQGPNRISAELAREKWGGLRISSNGVWRVLRRHGLSKRAARLGLVAGYQAPPEPAPRLRPPERHIEADHPGSLVQMDCFCIGRITGTKGTLWQYSAIDVASSYLWAELHATAKNPSAKWTSELARHVALDLSQRGWKLEAVSSDNGSEFVSSVFTNTITRSLGAQHRRIKAGRPQSNGCVERVQETILDECWKPAFARFLIPKQTGLRRELKTYVQLYNTDRAHTGRRNKGRTPEQVIGKAKMYARS
jgi:transposase InsO family protein/transposase-like protein